jgi:hypothetical protein
VMHRDGARGQQGRARHWRTLTDEERWKVASRTVDKLKEHGDQWKLDEEMEAPTEGAHTTPLSFTEAHKR